MLLFFHNPDFYDTANIETYWNVVGGSPFNAAIRPDGYLGRPALTCSSGDTYVGQILEWPPITPPGGADFFMGGRFLFESWPAGPTMIMAALDFAGTFQTALVLNADGTLSIYRGTYHDEIAGPTGTPLALDTFYRLGLKGRVHPSAGSAEAWINVTRILQASGNTAANGGAGNFSGCAWGLVEDCAVNHVYMGDQYGYQNDLIPGLLVKPLFPDVVSPLNQWTAFGGSVPQAIDDPVPDDDATYIGGTANQQHYGVSVDTLDPTPTIHAVQTTVLVKNGTQDGAAHVLEVIQDGAIHQAAQHIASNGGVKGWAVPMASGGFYRAIRRVDYGSPRQLGEGWTVDLVNAAEFGGRVVV